MTAVPTAVSWVWAIQILREDDAPVDQREVVPDFGPWHEWVRWLAVRAGRPPHQAFTDPGELLPRWDEVHGEPRLRGVRVRVGTKEAESGLEPFHEPARNLIAHLVQEGRLAAGDRVRWRALAFARDGATQPVEARLGRPAPPDIPLVSAPLDGEACVRADDDPVLVPDAVLAEVSALTLAATGQETGGILIGHLCRDAGSGAVFERITAQVPARHTEADATRLTFTPATWTEARSAIALRGQEELMLGWWHSHPVRAWCHACDDACRARCTLGEGFLSADDRRLHRAVFPRAYSLALVANDVSDTGPTFTLFGWRRGVLEPRPFTRTGRASR